MEGKRVKSPFPLTLFNAGAALIIPPLPPYPAAMETRTFAALYLLSTASFSASAQFCFPNLKGIKLPGGLQLPTGNPGTTWRQ